MAIPIPTPVPLSLRGKIEDSPCLCTCCNSAPVNVVYINQHFEREKKGILATIRGVFKKCCCCCPAEDTKEKNRRAHEEISNNFAQSIQLFLPGGDPREMRQRAEEETAPLLAGTLPDFQKKAEDGEPITEEAFWAIKATKTREMARRAHAAAEAITHAPAPRAVPFRRVTAAVRGQTGISELLPELRREVHLMRRSTRETVITTLRPQLEEWGYTHFTDGQIYILHHILIRRTPEADLTKAMIERVVALFRNSPLPKTALDELVPQMRRWVRVRRGEVTIPETRAWLEEGGYFIQKDGIILLLIELLTPTPHQETAERDESAYFADLIHLGG